jgi:hypothetical protein
MAVAVPVNLQDAIAFATPLAKADVPMSPSVLTPDFN